MKNFTVGIVVAIALLVCCSSNTKEIEYPKTTIIAQTKFGHIEKFRDGDRTIYVYERASGGASISVVKDSCE